MKKEQVNFHLRSKGLDQCILCQRPYVFNRQSFPRLTKLNTKAGERLPAGRVVCVGCGGHA